MDIDQYERLLGEYRHGCVFCKPDPALVIRSDELFGVCADVAPLVPGHLIIHSREHYSCAGEVPAAEIPALCALVEETRALVRETFGSVTLYEHGRAGHCLADGMEHRLCHHFHLHCVPGDYPLAGVLGQRFERHPVEDYTTITELYEQYGDYLYLENEGSPGSYFVVNQVIERHLMRTLIADCLGEPDRADWRGYSDGTLLAAGMEAIAGAPRARGKAVSGADGVA